MGDTTSEDTNESGPYYLSFYLSILLSCYLLNNPDLDHDHDLDLDLDHDHNHDHDHDQDHDHNKMGNTNIITDTITTTPTIHRDVCSSTR